MVGISCRNGINMPCATRPNKKAKKIAYAILGVPMNLQKQNWKKNKKVENRLVFEETSRVR
jgi:hypothetical protein